MNTNKNSGAADLRVTIENKLDALDALIKDILADAEKTKGQFTKKTCPLEARGNHYQDSEMLGGLGCHTWHCPLCGAQYRA